IPGDVPNVVVARAGERGPSSGSRTFDERLMVRLPGVYRMLAALVWGLLSPRWRLRRALLCRQQVSAYAAASRRDWELMLVRYARDVGVEFDPDLEPLGLSGIHRGHDGLMRMIETFQEAWDQPEFRPAMVLDMGDHGVGLLGHI